MNDLTLEQYRLGELPADVRAAVERAAETDATIRERLRAIDAHTEAVHQQGLTRELAARVSARATAAPAFRPAWRSLVAAGAVVAMIALVPRALERPTSPAGGRSPDVTDRVKGAPATLLVFRQVSEGSEQLPDGAVARRGDLLRVAYRASAEVFGVILSIDGAGVVTRHFPQAGGVASALHAGEPTPLDSAYELDDAPRWERFFLVTSDRSFSIESVMQAARGAVSASPAEPPPALPLPAGLEQTSFLLRKVP